jgi:hypothetical protein
VNTSYIDSTGSHGDILAFDFTDPSQPALISVMSALHLLPFIRAASVPHTLFHRYRNSARRIHRRPRCARGVRGESTRDPSNPLVYPRFSCYYFDGLASANGFVYAASGNGLNIYQSLVQ